MSDDGSVAGDPTDHASGWRRLDARTLAVRAGRLVGSMGTFVLFFVVLRSGENGTGASLVVLVALSSVVLLCAELARYLRTSFRVTDARVELRTGLVSVRHSAIPRERVRRVELTAGVLHRALGVSTVTVGTGEHGGDADSLTLDAVDRAVAAALRSELLSAQVSSEHAAPAAADAEASQHDEVLQRLDWRWAPYDVLSYWTLLLPLMALGGLYQLLSNLGVDPIDPDVVESGSDLLSSWSWWVLAAGALAAALLVGVAGSLASFVITWWGYELVREPGDRLRLQRGLFTTRSTTLDEHRIRGLELRESLPVRLVDAGRLRVVAHGLAGEESATSDRADALLPPVPRQVADVVGAAVLRTASSPLSAALVPHPPAARARRLVRAALVSSAAAVVVVLLVALGAGAAWLLVVLPVTVGSSLYALDAARSLGHRLDDRFLVTRIGSLNRRTAALARRGIIGWSITQSYFQRRRGLATLVATTAAGSGAYAVVDLRLEDAVALAAHSTPELLEPLLER